eukprot:CAMPEP_0201484524 /NCGR_PEP_ID=MMETSP0151_2-20130828/8707_1 /ASSEMBLY_ACC=CAM_ASM_000257 /TAXON_ID=200890 /ORGANISM="Paramoeba atlantica, Strain 621/1 / CCAP 1560/9" /LENGTH=52 /DNA_ID=CAMNT_0047868233 /DNA_START=119 /DNA_END=274 /DNA_ORIENTATION=+
MKNQKKNGAEGVSQKLKEIFKDHHFTESLHKAYLLKQESRRRMRKKKKKMKK